MKNQHFLQNIEEKRAEKRLLISNIKLAILNMHKYANRWGLISTENVNYFVIFGPFWPIFTHLCKYRRAVSLPGDREEDREREKSIGDQLNNIISHIEVWNIHNNNIHKYKNICTNRGPAHHQHHIAYWGINSFCSTLIIDVSIMSVHIMSIHIWWKDNFPLLRNLQWS